MLKRHTVATVCLLIAMAYALVRYVWLGPVGSEQIPLLIVNKALAFAGLVLLAIALATGVHMRTKQVTIEHPWHPRRLSVDAMFFLILHTVVSLMIMSPAYYPKFFDGDVFTPAVGGSMLAGAVAMVLMLWQDRVYLVRSLGQPMAGPAALGTVIALIGAAHVLLMGYGGWLKPATWHAGLPPITLITFVIAIVAVAIRMAKIRK